MGRSALRLLLFLLTGGVSVLVGVVCCVEVGSVLCVALCAWRGAARGHLGGRELWERAVRLRDVGHHLVSRRGGVGEERGGERGALHDPIVITIVESRSTPKVEERPNGFRTRRSPAPRRMARAAGLPLLLLALAAVLTLLGFIYRPLGYGGFVESELVRQLRRELLIAQRKLLEHDLHAEHQSRAAESRNQSQRAARSSGSALPIGNRQWIGSSYVHTIATMPVRRGDWAMMTYATGGVHEMLENWVLHIKRIAIPILAIAMDEQVLNQCNAQAFDCLDWSKTKSSLDSEYVRGDESGFRKLGVRKVDALVAVLRAGVHVVLSDVDCVWSHDPGPIVRGIAPGYSAFANADLISATDCMNPQADRSEAGCFNGLIDKNTGVLAIRATEDGINVMNEWRYRLAIGQKNEQDQTTFMDMIDGNGRGHRWGMTDNERASWRKFAVGWCKQPYGMIRGFALRSSTHLEGERDVYDVCIPNVTRTLRMGIFPITDVAGGHTFFVQNLQSITGRWPAAVHATYQFGDQVRA